MGAPSEHASPLIMFDNSTYSFDQKKRSLQWDRPDGEDSKPYALYGLGNGDGLLDEVFGNGSPLDAAVDGVDIRLDEKWAGDPRTSHAISVSWDKNKFWTNNYVGLLQKGSQQIRIASRFSWLDYKPEKPDYFVDYMAISCGEEPATVPAEASPDLRGTLFNCATLWEHYLATLLEKSFHHTNSASREHAQTLFINKDGKGCVDIYPDFISKSEPRVIADAKYKHICKDLNDQNDMDDFYQMLTYMLRFNAHTGLLLYPISEGHQGENPIEYELADGMDGFEGMSHTPRFGNKIRLVKVGFKVPAQARCKDYPEFEEKMHASEDRFMKMLGELGAEDHLHS